MYRIPLPEKWQGDSCCSKKLPGNSPSELPYKSQSCRSGIRPMRAVLPRGRGGSASPWRRPGIPGTSAVRTTIAHRLDEDIFRGVFQGDELHDVHIIAAGFQELSADAVGEQRREPLLDDAMLEHHLHAVILDLGEQLMLTAGNSEQNTAVPADGLDNGGIGCHVAGVPG